MSKYTPTIGLEIHAELKTDTKMFCGCKNDPHASESNSNVCPVCLAHPGTLPTVNESAVEKVIQFGVAVGSNIATFSEFDRKNYFYPDIPKAYQISQYAFPLVSGGEIAGVPLTRVHLEEDTARSQHDTSEGSLVDFNRAGVPLMELVTEPEIHDADTAASFAKELQLLLRTLGISDANMEKGEMRVEANISISDSDELGTKVEVKNLNSFKAVRGAIEYEIERQTVALESGNKLVQETRGWDEVKNRTFSQRSKETAKDYRYFPDPDIPKLQVDSYPRFNKSRLEEIMPILPNKKRENYRNLGLNEEQVDTLIQNKVLDKYFHSVTEIETDLELLKLTANYLITDFAPLLQNSEPELTLSPNNFLAIVKLAYNSKINSRTAKNLIMDLFDKDVDPEAYARNNNLLQASDEADLIPMVQEIIAQNQSVVDEYLAGKEASLKFLIGQGMKVSKGTANPQVLAKLLESEITKK